MYIKPLNEPEDYPNYEAYRKDAERWLEEHEKAYNSLLDEIFNLVYHIKLEASYVEQLTPKERNHFWKRFLKQREYENNEAKKAGRR